MSILDEPIFIFSISPRSGSTWLQRMLTSTGDVLIWGEFGSMPFPHGCLWTDAPIWKTPPKINDLRTFRKKKADMWMAVLLPEEERAFRAYRGLCDYLFAEAVIKEGYHRWGMKQTDWGTDTLRFVKAMYPKATTLFLHRAFDESFTSRFKGGEPQNGTHEGDVKLWCECWVRQAEAALQFAEIGRFISYEELLKLDDTDVIKFCKSLGLSAPDPKQYRTKISCSGEKAPIKDSDMTLLGPYAADLASLQSKLRNETHDLFC